MEVDTEKLIALVATITTATIASLTPGTVDATAATLFRIPQIAGASLPAAAAANKGMIVYNTTTNKLNFSTGSAWEALTSA